MDTEKIKLVTKQFALEVKKLYGDSLRDIILYGSCARGDFEKDSDIDIMVLLDIPQEQIGKARKKLLDISDRLDLDNDVVLSPVIQNYRLYKQYMPVSVFYQNVQTQKRGAR